MGSRMARRTFVVVDIIEIFVHWCAGRRSNSEVATSLGVDAKTVRKYLKPAERSGIVPGGLRMAAEDWTKLIRSWFPELTDRRAQALWPPPGSRWAHADQHLLAPGHGPARRRRLLFRRDVAGPRPQVGSRSQDSQAERAWEQAARNQGFSPTV
jgi:hypothetical protein